ncbi:MAG: PaaI family thioesterase [Myxococcales bacterium]|nr:PaaI family thioesterase [Myxococcales bacterium]MCB9519501.1 PaaI family thioesterase [Myxococcales bacterium]MCB9532101.1 PaaI family thioesterase [Myxococcales bacterium]MCB9533274.1 PaaI family thioesterase [Myxococcales bacterium]
MSERIWRREATLVGLNAMGADTLMSALGIEVVELGAAHLTGRMPVTSATTQPMRLLHGGATVALAETLGSIAGNLCLEPGAGAAVGLEVNANHLRSAREGEVVLGEARPLRLGGRTQVWEIRVRREGDGELVAVCRLTLAVVSGR